MTKQDDRDREQWDEERARVAALPKNPRNPILAQS